MPLREVEVSRDEFFAVIHPQNVTPSSHQDASLWYRYPGRVLVGRSTPGYLCRGPRAWFLMKEVDDAG